MWVTVNAVQIIYLSLALNLLQTIHVRLMLSYLSLVNMENQYLARLFLFAVDEDQLSDEPLDERFDSVGYGSQSFLINAAEAFSTWEIAFTLLFLFSVFRLRATENSGRCKRTAAKLCAKSLELLKNEMILRTFLELFLDLLLCSAMDLERKVARNTY